MDLLALFCGICEVRPVLLQKQRANGSAETKYIARYNDPECMILQHVTELLNTNATLYTGKNRGSAIPCHSHLFPSLHVLLMPFCGIPKWSACSVPPISAIPNRTRTEFLLRGAVAPTKCSLEFFVTLSASALSRRIPLLSVVPTTRLAYIQLYVCIVFGPEIFFVFFFEAKLFENLICCFNND